MQADPNRTGLEVRQDLRRQIDAAAAAGDAARIVQSVRHLLDISGTLPEVKFCANLFLAQRDALQKQLKARSLKTFVARSVTLEPIVPYLVVEGVLANLNLDLHLGGYGSFFEEMLNPASALGQLQPDLVLVILDLEDIAGRLPDLAADGIGSGVDAEIADALERMTQLLQTFRSTNPARLVVQGCVVPDTTALGDVGDANLPNSLPNAVLRLNQGLAHLCRGIPDCVFFDVDRLAARHGRGSWRDQRLFLASRLPVAAPAFSTFARGLVRSLSSLVRPPKKVLVTDLDNTLWGGVLGEDGTDGIATGSAFPGNSYLSYQRYLHQLASRGILLAIASKNNEPDVREAFQIRSADLALNLSDFVATRINWNEKSASLQELAHELSLGLDSFVFVDDNPVECAAIQAELPDVTVIAAPLNDPWKLVDILSSRGLFDAASVTEDDLNRLNDYKAQAQRAQVEHSSSNREEFLGSLGIVATVLSALEAPLARSVQLLAKTNQFNTTTRRHSAAEIERFAQTPGSQAVAIRVRDRFGDAGVVGLALSSISGDTCTIDSFVLSCRVIGRGIETALLAWLAEAARHWGAHRLVGEFVPTKKNAPAASFYPDHGFTPCASNPTGEPGNLLYELDLTQNSLTNPAWITLEGIPSHELSDTRSPVLAS